MGAEVLILTIILGTIFGIIYLFVSARNKERLALIDKGADASIFYHQSKEIPPIWKIVVLHAGLGFMGIGLGIYLGGLLHYGLGIEEGIAFPGSIFLMAGSGLLVGFYKAKNWTKN